MGRKKKIGSRLVSYTVTAKAPNSDTWEQWEIRLQGNRIREDRSDWLKLAREYYSDIRLTRVKSTASTPTTAKQAKSDIARAGLAILDKILAERKTGKTDITA